MKYTLISLWLCIHAAQSFAADIQNTNSEISRAQTQENTKVTQESYLEGLYPTYPTPTPGTTPKENELIKRGEYLAKMGDCIACHTDVKNNKPSFAGGLPIPSPFGTFYSPNITSDPTYGIGKWTKEDFWRAMKKGRAPQGYNYFPSFPYIYFANASDDDIEALYTYFMHVPAVALKSIPQPFPFNIPGSRLSLWGWNLLFFFPNSVYQYDSDKSPEWNRGKYIVDGLGHCSMCHTPMNVLGSPKSDYYLSGGFISDYWAPNITSSGLKSIPQFDIADVFRKNILLNNAGPVAGPMAEVNHNSLSHLTEEDQLAIAMYLKTVISEDPLYLAPSKAPPNLKRGKQVYVNACIICHQKGKMGAPLIGNGPGWTARLQQNGLTGLYQHAVQGFNSMPIKGACVTCSDNDVIAAVNYILQQSLSRSEWSDLKKGGPKEFPTSGKQIYEEKCAICHSEGKLGAPKIGDKEAWKPLIAENIDILVEKAINSPHHPKNAGCPHCTTGEILDAIKYIVSQSKTEGNYTLW